MLGGNDLENQDSGFPTLFAIRIVVHRPAAGYTRPGGGLAIPPKYVRKRLLIYSLLQLKKHFPVIIRDGCRLFSQRVPDLEQKINSGVAGHPVFFRALSSYMYIKQPKTQHTLPQRKVLFL